MFGRVGNEIAARMARCRQRGASAVEYGLLVAGIAALIASVVFLLGQQNDETFNDVNACVSSEGATCP